MELTASRYNIHIPLRDGGALLYNSAMGNYVRLDAREVKALDSIRGGQGSEVPPALAQELLENGLAVRADLDELQQLRDAYEAHRFDTHSMTLTVAPTMACNFGCDYCFQGANKPSESMSVKVQDALVDFIERCGERGLKSLGLVWYGGEPLLRLPIIESLSDRIMAVCDQNGIRYNAMVVTNAYKLDLATARSLKARKVNQVQITLDGTPEYHDSRRYLLGGKGSFERILQNMREIVDEVPMMYSVRVNIDDRNRNDIRQLIDLMAEMGLGHKPNLGMYFAPVEAITEGCHSVSDVTMAKGSYAALETDLYQHGYKAGIVSPPNPPRFHGVCGAVRPSGLVVLPTGDIHKCWDTVSWPDKRVGTIFEVDQIAENEVSLAWLKWTPFENKSCRNCRILPNCAGACAYKFVYPDTTRGEAATLPCPSWKYNIKERLLFKAVALGKVKADEYDPVAIATVPAELCTDDVIAGGQDLPPEIAAHYEKQKRYLPVVRG